MRKIMNLLLLGLMACFFALPAMAEEGEARTTGTLKNGTCPKGEICLKENSYGQPEIGIPIQGNLFFYDIQSGAYPCGPPISDLAGHLAIHKNYTDSVKNRLMQMAIDFNNCCSESSLAWLMYEVPPPPLFPKSSESSDEWRMYEEHKRSYQAFSLTCQLKQQTDQLTFVNALKKADFFATCPSLTEYIDTMTEFPDSRLGVLLIIGKAEQENCDHVQLNKIKNEVEEKREHLWDTRYNIDYRLFEVDYDRL